MKPSASAELENTLKRLHHELQHMLTTIKPRYKWENVTNEEKHSIKTLRRKSNIYLPSDKGRDFCVIDEPT